MKINKIETLPKCDFCGKDAKYDAPTSHGGSWANMCQGCFDSNKSLNAEAVGTQFEQRTPAKPKEDGKILIGIEPSDTGYMEDVYAMDANRQISCPECEEVKEVEPDAEYVYTCEGCGSKVQVPAGIM